MAIRNIYLRIVGYISQHSFLDARHNVENCLKINWIINSQDIPKSGCHLIMKHVKYELARTYLPGNNDHPAMLEQECRVIPTGSATRISSQLPIIVLNLVLILQISHVGYGPYHL